jgi:hypothetical protein
MTYRNGSMRENDEKDEVGFTNIEMTPFRKAIVFGCVRWNSKMRYTMKNKKISKGNIFTIIIRLQCIHALIEVFFRNGLESNEYGFYPSIMYHLYFN